LRFTRQPFSVYHPWNKSFKDFPSMVKAFSGKEGCEEVL